MTRLLVIGDAGVNTGFERVVRGILEHLHSTEKYDLVVRGVGYNADAPKRTYPWTVKSAWAGQTDPLGVSETANWIAEDKPDAMLLVQDLWNIVHYLAWKPRELPSVAYFPVDAPNMKWNYAVGAAAATEAVSYTAFGVRETAAGVRHAVDVIGMAQEAEGIRQAKASWFTVPNPRVPEMELHFRADRTARLQNLSSWHVVPHGMEAGLFEPRDKATCRRLLGLPQDVFIVLNVNTNQFRKRQDLTMRAFRELLQERPDALLVFHCQGGNKGADSLDIMQAASLAGVAHRTICIHHHEPNLSDDQLVSLYNCADVQINTCGGEGWGLTSFEGAACGVPQLVPDWSATRELWTGYGALLPVSDWRLEYRGGLNTAHACVDPRAAGQLLLKAAQDDVWREELRAGALAQTKRAVSWDAVGAAFDQIIERALNAPAPLPMSLDDIVAAREGEVKSELAGCVDMEDVRGTL